MKRIILSLVIVCLLLVGCNQKEVDYSNYEFTDISWTRETDADIEYIRFSSNGDFSYYCACGSPVNDSDVCERYTYNEAKKEIKIKCSIPTKDTVKTIKVINVSENTLELDFDGEIKIFNIETEE